MHDRFDQVCPRTRNVFERLWKGADMTSKFRERTMRVITFMRRLAACVRVVTFDKGARGPSDRVSGVPTLHAVIDTIGSTRAVLIGFSEGRCINSLFSATYPERVSHLILIGCFSRSADPSPDDAWQSLLHSKTANQIPIASSSQQSPAARLVEYPTGDRYSGSAIPKPFTAISRSPLPGLATVLQASSSACSQR